MLELKISDMDEWMNTSDEESSEGEGSEENDEKKQEKKKKLKKSIDPTVKKYLKYLSQIFNCQAPN